MDQIWIDMYNAAKAVLGGVTISDYVTAGEVAPLSAYAQREMLFLI